MMMLWLALCFATNNSAWFGTAVVVTNMRKRNFPLIRGTISGILKVMDARRLFVLQFHAIGPANEQAEKNVWVVEMICNLVKNLPLNSYGAALMSMGVKILVEPKLDGCVRIKNLHSEPRD